MEAAENSVSIMRSLPMYSSLRAIACYAAFKDEFPTSALIEAMWQDNKSVYLPVLIEDCRLVFVPYNKGGALIKNRYGIDEPADQSITADAKQLDMVLLPLVAFDKQGNRLGTGGGYYDRTFAWKKEQVNEKPQMVGVGYAIQQAENLPQESWDISLDAVITEMRIIQCK